MPRERKSLDEHNLSRTKPKWTLPDSDATAGRPKYPRGISGEAKSAFKRLVRMLEQRRALTPGDQEILRLYGVLFDRHERALKKIAEQGDVCTYTRLNNKSEEVMVEKPNSYLKIAETCESKMLAYLVQLGLTPGTRGKIKLTEKAAAPDPEAHLLSRQAPQPALEKEIPLPDETKVQVQ
jgi:P27 family predicted phage terminase small subunit